MPAGRRLHLRPRPRADSPRPTRTRTTPTPTALSGYAYAANNPATLSDPSGLHTEAAADNGNPATCQTVEALCPRNGSLKQLITGAPGFVANTTGGMASGLLDFVAPRYTMTGGHSVRNPYHLWGSNTNGDFDFGQLLFTGLSLTAAGPEADAGLFGSETATDAGLGVTVDGAGGRSVTPGIYTPHGPAYQSSADAAVAARATVESGAPIYRIGTIGKSQAAEGQFWSLEHPLTPGFASRYGIPAENVSNADFLEEARVPQGIPFITREAPGVGSNLGGGIEVVVPAGGGDLNWFSVLDPKEYQ